MNVMQKTNKISSFEQRVLEVVSHIPHGVIMTYREVAESIGNPRSSRAVGSVLKKNKDPEIPCFRVVRSDGSPGQYNRGEDRKRRLLLEEGSLDAQGKIRRYYSRKKLISRDTYISVLRSGGVGVFPTDTVYGLVCQARDKQAVERIYRLRKRRPEKACIILISHIRDMFDFGVRPTGSCLHLARVVWPGPVSVIFPCEGDHLAYLHRGNDSLAFRFPSDPDLLEVLRQTGPLLAPSANIEGQPIVKTVKEAVSIFGDRVDAYTDGGCLRGHASTLIACEKDGIVLKRAGKVGFSFIQRKLKKL